MRRFLLPIAAVAVLAVLAAAVILVQHSVNAAHPPKSANDRRPLAIVQLPIAKVMMYPSGVGYFQREGKVLGNSRVDLSFPVQDINDLLKSMVLRDKNGGHISAVSYDSQAPVERTLK